MIRLSGSVKILTLVGCMNGKGNNEAQSPQKQSPIKASMGGREAQGTAVVMLSWSFLGRRG